MDGDASHTKIANLVPLARKGDVSARDQLLTKYRPYLRLLAGQRLHRYFNKRTDGSDIVQQTLIDAVRGLTDFRGRSEAEFTAWMLKLLERNLLQSARLNTAAKRDVRREVPKRNGESSAQLVWHSLAGDGGSPQSSVFRGEAALQLAQALEQLPEDQRIAVEFRYLQQQPIKTIAEQMEKSSAAVAGLIRRGVDSLRPLLPNELGES